jgi:ATP-dependent RNA helicase DeaD
LEGIDREELIKKIVSVEFTQFYNYYSKTKDLNSQDGGRDRDGKGTSKGEIPSEGSVRYFINVGERDGYDWMSLKDFLRDTLNLEKEDIFNVDTKDSFSFFNSDAHLAELIIQTFSEFKLEGRFINVEISTKPGGGGGKGGGKKRGHRKGGHRKGGSNKPSFKGGKKGGYGKKGGKKRSGFY